MSVLPNVICRFKVIQIVTPDAFNKDEQSDSEIYIQMQRT